MVSGQDLKKSVALNVSVTVKLMNMLAELMKQCTIQKERCILKMQQKSIPMTYPISTLLQEVFPVRHFQSQGEEMDSMIQEERSASRLLELLPLKDPLFCSLKTFPDCFRMTKAGHLLPSLMHWTKLGMMSRGLSLTARTLVFPNPEIECSLQDFLEKNAGAKYSLSAKQIQRLLSDECREVKVIEFTQLMDSQLLLPQAAVEAEEKQDSI